MAEVICTHEWETCPIHNPDGGVPNIVVATTCIYGGAPTVDGDEWDEHDSKEVWERVFKRLEA